MLHSVYRGVQLVIGRLCRDNIVDFNDGSTCAKFSVYKHIPGTIHLSLESGLQRYGTLFFLSKKWEKTLWKQKATELQSYNPSLPGMRTILFFCKKKWKKVTELQSYRPPLLGIRNSKLQSYRATGTIFFPPGKKVTKLQSYRVTGHIFFFAGKKKLQSYRVTGHPSRQSGILSYRATELREPFFSGGKKKLQSYRVTELRDTFFFSPKKKVTELQSYRVTGQPYRQSGILSYRVTELQSYRTFFFFFKKKKKVTELQSYRVTKLQNWNSIHITCHIYSSTSSSTRQSTGDSHF